MQLLGGRGEGSGKGKPRVAANRAPARTEENFDQSAPEYDDAPAASGTVGADDDIPF
jgi:single-stranded DNA-binding protein